MSLFNRISGGRGLNTNTNPGNKEVCKFFLEGRCRYGDACRFYHPPRDQSSQSRGQQLPYHLNGDAIKSDLTAGDERPSWPLSAYGPGRDAPRELLEGVIEVSPEELRMQYYLGKASGSTQEYEQNERSAIDQANQQADRILNDMEGAIKYVIDGKDQHPNREDVVLKGPSAFNWVERPSFNQSAASSPSTSTFGQPAALGSTPAFGQSSAPGTQQTTTFGQPSTFGSGFAFGSKPQTGGSAFGQASNLGSQTSAFGARTSAFGAPSALGSGGSAFGKPSPLGGGASGGGSTFGQASSLGGSTPFGGGGGQAAPNTQGSAFGQASVPGGGPAFGKPSPFGAAATSSTSTFGQSTPFGGANLTSSTAPAFGQPSAPGQQASAFGQSTNMGQQQSTFGQSTGAGQQQSPFGQSTNTGQQSAFGQSTNAGQAPSPFGQAANTARQPSAFGQPTSIGQQQSAFGQASAPSQQQSAFGRPSPFSSSAPSTGASAFGQPAAENRPTGAGSSNVSSPFANQQITTAAATRAPGQPLTSWKGRRVTAEDGVPFYPNDAGKKERIWHPDGPPGPNADVEAAEPSVYDDVIGKALKEIYDYVKEHGTFKDGLVPEIPPKREWVSWDV